jgi:hypothetical protein
MRKAGINEKDRNKQKNRKINRKAMNK